MNQPNEVIIDSLGTVRAKHNHAYDGAPRLLNVTNVIATTDQCIPKLSVQVAQVSNLLYRSASSLRRHRMEKRLRKLWTVCRLEIGDTAGWKPALRAVAN